MIRVNPRQAPLRAPEITAFPIPAPLGAGRGRAGAQRSGAGEGSHGRSTGEGKAGGLLPKGTAFAPSLTSLAGVPGHPQGPRGLPACPARAPLCSLAPNSAGPSRLARALLLPSAPHHGSCFPGRSPLPAPGPSLRRSWLCPGRCCRAPSRTGPSPRSSRRRLGTERLTLATRSGQR